MRNDSSYRNLRLLIGLRWVSIAGQAAVLFLAVELYGLQLRLPPLIAVLGCLVVANLLSRARLRFRGPIRTTEFLGQLLLDIGGLYLMLRYSGGAANPFASLFILQVVIAAIILPPRLTWAVALLAIGFYTALLVSSEGGMSAMHPMGEAGFGLHVEGMWCCFVLLALIVAGFVVRLNATIRRQERVLADSEQVAAVGMLAANAAHELGTPLMTLSLLAEGYAAPMPDAERQRKSQLFAEQLARCRAILGSITAVAGVDRAEEAERLPLDRFLSETLRHWQGTRSQTGLDIALGEVAAPMVVAERSLAQALVNLLDNAADASPLHVRFEASWDARRVILIVRDHGPGISPALRHRLGQAGVTDKSEGLGMGIFLARRAVERFGGTLGFAPTESGGTQARIELPLERIRA